MHIIRINRLTDFEFQNAGTTTLFSDLVKRKFHVDALTAPSLEKLLNRLEDDLGATWFFQREAGYDSATGIIYVSTDADAKTISKIK